MDRFAEALEEIVRGLGSVTAGLGLFVVAFFDSSLLSLPEINDILLIYFGTQFGEKAYYYAAMTTLGSVTGASLLYFLARWKGYGYLRKRFPSGKIESVFGLVKNYGALAIALPAVLPPPFPFKIFVLSAGVLGLPYSRFLVAIVAGRSFRYFGESYLAVRFGDQALAFLRANAANVALVTALSAILGIAIFYLVQRRSRRLANAERFRVRSVQEP